MPVKIKLCKLKTTISICFYVFESFSSMLTHSSNPTGGIVQGELTAVLYVITDLSKQ